MEGIDAARAIRIAHPNVGIVVLSQYNDSLYALELFRDGTAGLAYLLKDRVGDRDALVHALAETSAGRSVVDAQIIDVLVAARRRRRESALARLTPRELEVLAEIAQGHSNAAVAARLFLSESAVGKHISAIFAKLGLTEADAVDRRVTAVLAYLRETG
jgi:DNA-binding NarL/FixJ family response regulator